MMDTVKIFKIKMDSTKISLKVSMAQARKLRLVMRVGNVIFVSHCGGRGRWEFQQSLAPCQGDSHSHGMIMTVSNYIKPY